MTHKFPTRWDRFKKWLVYGDQEVVTRWQSFKCWVVYGHRWNTTGTSKRDVFLDSRCVICNKRVIADRNDRY